MAAILQICSDAGTPTAGTQALETLFESTGFAGGGHTVTLRSDETGEQAGDETTYAVVVIDESCSSATVGTDYEDYTIPLLVLEAGVWDDHDFAYSKSSVGDNKVKVDNDGFPLCDTPNDLGVDTTSLTVTVTATGMDYATDANLASSFIEFVTYSNQTQNVGFAFEDGATLLNSNTATARRVGLGFNDAVVDDLSTVGENVIENALDWLLPDAPDAGLLPIYRRNVYHQSRRQRESQVFA